MENVPKNAKTVRARQVVKRSRLRSLAAKTAPRLKSTPKQLQLTLKRLQRREYLAYARALGFQLAMFMFKNFARARQRVSSFEFFSSLKIQKLYYFQ